MAKYSVDILLKARDQASAKFNKIGKSGMNMGSMLKKAAAMAAFYFGARTIKRQLQESLELFGKQEAAVKSLSDALGLIGKNSVKAMIDMQKFASSIQQVTIYGDEVVLELMAMGASMGKLAGDELKEATKAAIGLSVAFKMETVAAMRLVARAAVGDTAQLKRYGIIVDASLSSQEKFNEVLAIGTEKFKLAEGQAKTYAGSIQQMKNALGDLKEKIGEAIAPVIAESARRIKLWAEQNADAIAKWVKKTVNAAILIKDVFVNFIKFMKDDWTAGLKFALNTFLKTLKTFAVTAVRISVALGRGMYLGIKQGLTGKEFTESDIIGKTSELLKKMGYEKGYTSSVPLKVYDEARAKAIKDLEAEGMKKLLGDSMEKAALEWQKTFKQIGTDMPKDLFVATQKSFDEYQRRALGLTIEAGTPGGFVPSVIEALTDSISGIRPRLAFQEARMLQYQPGAKFDKVETNTKKSAAGINQIVSLMKKVVENTKGSNLPKTELAIVSIPE